MTWKSCILFLAMLAAGSCYITPDKPNIILITFDALRADHLGVYGYKKNTSPNLDRFAKEALVFTDNICQSGSTLTSLPSMITGRFPVTDKIMLHGEKVGLKQTEITLPEILKKNGYFTASVVNNKFAGPAFGMDKGFDLCKPAPHEKEKAEETLVRVLEMLDHLEGQEKPFFLWVHFIEPHVPYYASDAVFDEFYQGEEPTLQRYTHKQVLQYYSVKEKAICYKGLGYMTETMVRQVEALYDGTIRKGDEAFAKLMERIDGSDWGEQSMILIGADHGECMGEHNCIGHNALHWGILHTPLMLRLPDRKHEMRSYPVMNVDMAPTVLDLLGIEIPQTMRGRSLLNKDRKDYFQVAEYETNMTIKKNGFQMHLLNSSSKPRLYDVFSDPLETTDISQDHPKVTKGLRDLAKSLRTLSNEDRLMKDLKALGYIK